MIIMNKIKLFIKQNFQCNHIWEMKEIFTGDMKNRGYGIIKCKRCGKEKIVKESIF